MKDYETLLKNAPPHDSDAFVQYLRDHNKVAWDDKHWLVIENAKYHTEERPWFTAFHVGHDHWTDCIYRLSGADWRDWNWLKKSADKQTVQRLHIHMYKDEKKTSGRSR